MTVKKITICGMLSCLAMAISLVEQYISLDIVLPGLKLGLANIVTVFAILYIGKKEAFFILFTRIVIVAFVSGRIASLLFSLWGGIFAWGIMCLLLRFYRKSVSIVGMSIAGAACHNIGQILVGVITVGSVSVMAYLPYLLILSIPVGMMTGILLHVLLINNNFLAQLSD